MPELTLVIPEIDSANDNEFVITHWHETSGSPIKVGDPIVDVETSKSTVEVVSEKSGFLYFLLPSGTLVKRYSAIALISPVELTDIEVREALSTEPKHPVALEDSQRPNGPVFSDQALRALDECMVPSDRFASDSFVTEEMVRAEARRVQGKDTSGTHTQARIDASRLVVVGGGGHAATLLDLVHETKAFTVIGILDDRLSPDHLVQGIPVIGQVRELMTLWEQGCALAINAVGGIGSRGMREDVWLRIKDSGLGTPRLIHPSAVIDSSVILGEGVQILAGSYVGARSQVGINSIVNSAAVVSHDCVIHEHSHVAPGAMLAGGVVIGQRTLVGMGTTIHMQVRIGDDVVVQNNSNIYEDLSNQT